MHTVICGGYLKHVGLSITMYMYVHGAYTVFWAGTLPNIRSCTVHMYRPGQSKQ